MKNLISFPASVPVENGDALCREYDGCPTEKVVLQRFWREHQLAPTAASDAALPVAYMLESDLDVLETYEGQCQVVLYRKPRKGRIALVRAAADDTGAMTSAARDVLSERERQVTAEGWTHGHDDEHTEREMARAAACYVLAAGRYDKCEPPPLWPWGLSWWKPATPRRNLVKAAALILAEIERIDRASDTGAVKTGEAE